MRVFARNWLVTVALSAGAFGWPAVSLAQAPAVFAADATRYLALGDSIAAGYKLVPVTEAYPYLLYQDGSLDVITHMLFGNAAAAGATSRDVLFYQVPQALIPFESGGFNPKYVTLTVGGNDLLSILKFASTHQNPADVFQFANQVLTGYAQNLGEILFELQTGLPGAKIFVANQYTIPDIQAVLPFTDQIISAFNSVVSQVVGQFAGNVYVVDVYQAFLGRNGLLLGQRNAASAFETHLTTTGHRVMAQAFADVIGQNK